MVRESIVIVVLLAIASYAFLRSKGAIWAGGVFPLMLSPLLNIFFSPKHLIHLPDAMTMRVLVYLVWFAATSLWAILWSRQLPVNSRRSRVAYIFCVVGFTLIFLLAVLFKGSTIE